MGFVGSAGGNGFLGDGISLDEEGTRLRLARLQTHDDVVPAGVRSLCHIGLAGVRLGVGVAMRASKNLETLGLGGKFGPQMFLRVNGVYQCAVSDVGARNKPHNIV